MWSSLLFVEFLGILPESPIELKILFHPHSRPLHTVRHTERDKLKPHERKKPAPRPLPLGVYSPRHRPRQIDRKKKEEERKQSALHSDAFVRPRRSHFEAQPRSTQTPSRRRETRRHIRREEQNTGEEKPSREREREVTDTCLLYVSLCRCLSLRLSVRLFHTSWREGCRPVTARGLSPPTGSATRLQRKELTKPYTASLNTSKERNAEEDKHPSSHAHALQSCTRIHVRSPVNIYRAVETCQIAPLLVEFESTCLRAYNRHSSGEHCGHDCYQAFLPATRNRRTEEECASDLLFLSPSLQSPSSTIPPRLHCMDPTKQCERKRERVFIRWKIDF